MISLTTETIAPVLGVINSACILIEYFTVQKSRSKNDQPLEVTSVNIDWSTEDWQKIEDRMLHDIRFTSLVNELVRA